MSCINHTFHGEWKKAWATDSTATSFASTAPTTSTPYASDGVVDMKGANSTSVSNVAIVKFFGAGADDDTFDWRIWGWREMSAGYDPILLAKGSCTISTCVGVTGGLATSSHRFADTITVAHPATGNISYQVCSPKTDGIDNIAGHLTLDLKGCRYLQFDFDRTGTTSACNALVAGY